MDLKTRTEKGVLVMAIHGELMGGGDMDTFRKTIDETIKEEQVHVVVDLGPVTWMNSSGLGMLISGLTSLRSSGGDLRLANVSDRIKRPLQITKLDKVFLQYPSVEEAIASY